MPDNKDNASTSHKDVMAALLEKKKQGGSTTPEHTEFGGKPGVQRGNQFAVKPQRPGGSRGRG